MLGAASFVLATYAFAKDIVPLGRLDPPPPFPSKLYEEAASSLAAGLFLFVVEAEET